MQAANLRMAAIGCGVTHLVPQRTFALQTIKILVARKDFFEAVRIRGLPPFGTPLLFLIREIRLYSWFHLFPWIVLRVNAATCTASWWLRVALGKGIC
jgi:hypothetical protein